MKKTVFLLGVIAASALIANEGEDPANQEEMQGLCESPVAECTDLPCCYLPPYLDLSCGGGLFITGEFLYWYGRETGLPYVLKTETVEATATLNGVETTGDNYLVPHDYEYFGTKWKPGVRLGIGWNQGCSGWDLYGFWTYYKNSNSESQRVTPFLTTPNPITPPIASPALIPPPGGFGLINPWVNPAVITTTATSLAGTLFSGGGMSIWERVDGSWEFRINTADVQLGYRFWVSPCMSMRLFSGVRAAFTKTEFITESFRSTQATLQNTSVTDIEYSTKDHFKNDFWGVGLVAGFEPGWHISSCISIFGSGDFALLWSEFDIKKKDSITVDSIFSPLGLDPVIRNGFLSSSSENNFRAMQAIIDLELGLRYETNFCCGQYYFAIDLGWEHHIYFDHNHRNRLTGGLADQNNPVSGVTGLAFSSFNESYGNIVFGGPVLQLRFDF